MPQKMQTVTLVNEWDGGALGTLSEQVRTNFPYGRTMQLKGRTFRVVRLVYPSDYRTTVYMREVF